MEVWARAELTEYNLNLCQDGWPQMTNIFKFMLEAWPNTENYMADKKK